MDVNLQKKLLREEFKARRARLSSKEVEVRSKKICANFINNLLPKIYQNPAQNFSLYLSTNNEVDCGEIKNFFIKNNIKFSYPKITNLDSALDFIAFDESQKLIHNNFFKKVLEPESGEKISPDILIIPLLAFDAHLQRLGMGGGFFDRTIAALKNKNPKIIIIGLAYEFQRFDGNLPTENTDCALDFIALEDHLIFRQ